MENIRGSYLVNYGYESIHGHFSFQNKPFTQKIYIYLT